MADLLARYPEFLTLWLVVFARVGTILMLLPAISDEAIPPRIRLLVALAVSVALSGLIAPRVQPEITSFRAIPGLVIAEVLVGLGIGMMMRIMFQSIGAAGAIISYQIGLSSAMVADPAMGGHTTVVSRFLLLAATLACLSLNIHHLWFAAILKSYQGFPVGALPPAKDFADLAVHTISQSLVLSLSLAAPLVVFGMLFNVGLALVSRITPTLQLFMVLAPLNVLLGVGLLAALVGAILTGFATQYGDWLNSGWTLPNG